MAWDIHIADVVVATEIVAPWGNEIRDRVVHPIPLFANLPVLAAPNVVNGDIAFAADTKKWYGLKDAVWGEFYFGNEFTVETANLNGEAGISFFADGTDTGIQIAATRVIQAFDTDAAAALQLNVLGGVVNVGANAIQFDPVTVGIYWSTSPSFDGIVFNDTLNVFGFNADGAPGHIDVGSVVSAGTISFIGIMDQGGVPIIDAVGAFVGPSINTAGNINGDDIIAAGFASAVGGFVVGDSVYNDGAIANTTGEFTIDNSSGGLDFVADGSSYIRFHGLGGVGPSELFKVRESAGFADVRFTLGLPPLGGTAAIGVVTGSESQLGLVSSRGSMKENVRPVGLSKIWDVQPVFFDWLRGGHDEGFIVEQLAAVDSRLAINDKDGPLQPNTNAILAEIIKGLHEIREMLHGARLR